MAGAAIAQNPVLTQALYYLQFAFGSPGFSVPMGLLIAGISVSALFAKILPDGSLSSAFCWLSAAR